MKVLILSLAVLLGSLQTFAQNKDDEDESRGFKKENLFTGGTLNLAFGNLQTQLGIAPFFDYSLNRFVDVGASFQFNYISERDYPYLGDKVRQKVYGPGAFVRLFPVDFLFAQAQYEFNMIRVKYIPFNNGGTNYPNERLKFDAHSLLIGAGYAGGRDFRSGEKSYYYLSIMWDVAKSMNSPYKDNLNRAVPIIRAGYNIALFQGDSGGNERRRRYQD